MRILFITMNGKSYPSSRLRVFNYLRYLDEKCDYDILPFGSDWVFRKQTKLDSSRRSNLLKKILGKMQSEILKKIDYFHNLLCYLRMLLKRGDYDLVFVQKVPLPQWIVKLIKHHRSICLIFDYDDAIFLNDGKRSTREIERINYLLKKTDSVITTSEFNKKYAQQFVNDVKIILTPVDTERYRPRNRPKHKDKVLIGWVGTPSTTIFLKTLLPALEKIDKTHKVAYQFIGAAPFDSGLKDVSFLIWDYHTEVRYLQEFDIGIMPLIQDQHALGKSGYKLLQYMALGIPSVASPVGVNRELIKNGENGFFAATEQDWVDKIALLIENSELRKTMGLKAREAVVKDYSLQVVAPTFLYSALKILQS